MADGSGIFGAVAALGSGNIVIKTGQAIAKGIKLASGGKKQTSATDVVSSIFQTALEACGTAGQVSLVQEIGADGFEEAFNMGLDSGRDASGVLSEFTEHPEAISEILENAEAEMTDVYQRGGW